MKNNGGALFAKIRKASFLCLSALLIAAAGCGMPNQEKAPDPGGDLSSVSLVLSSPSVSEAGAGSKAESNAPAVPDDSPSGDASSQTRGPDSEAIRVPTIKSIELLDEKGVALTHTDGWIRLKPKSRIRVNFEGAATKVDFFTTPTGTETYLSQRCIGTADVTEKDSSAELDWEVPDGFMGYLSVLVYHGDVARSSDRFLIKAILQ